MTIQAQHQRTYRFLVEAGDAVATLEHTLAIVRRLGLQMLSLRSSSVAGGMEVQLRVAGPEPEPLTLCRMRLHNVIGILSIREMPVLATRDAPWQATA